MTVNSNYGFPYPLSTEPVANGASNIQDLAQAVNDKIGLIKIASAGFTGVTTGAPLDVNGVFSSLFTNYRLVVRASVTGANNSSLCLRMRTATTQENGAVHNYGWGGSYVQPGPVFGWGGYSVTNPFTPDTFFFAGITPGIGYSGQASIDIFSPNAPRQTRFLGQGYTDYTGANYNVMIHGGGEVGTSTVYTGFRIFPSTAAGVYTGEYTLYGYTK
jgi:hypothetical protein